MRKLIATVFNYSLDGLLADEGTAFWKFCFDLPENREPDDRAQLDFLESAYAHIMGRTAYESIAVSMTTSTDHPFAPILNAAPKVVFSRTLKTADWANTTIAAGDTAEEIDKLRLGSDGHIVVWGGVSFWRSLMRLDLIDEFQLSLFPYVAGEGTRLFDDVPGSYRLDLVSSTASRSGIVELVPAAPQTQRLVGKPLLSRPYRASVRQSCVGVICVGRLFGDSDRVSCRQFVDGVAAPFEIVVPLASADAQDDARLVTSAEDDVLRLRRAVHEISLP